MESKISAVQQSYRNWCESIGLKTISDLNNALAEGRGVELINLCEAYQERKYADIATKIFLHKESVKIMLLAGPSSSGKTSSSLRIAQQARVLGLNPKVIELDNYFVDRELTPKDEKGEYDFECLGAMDIELFTQQVNDLLAGKEVVIPRYNFKEGVKSFDPKNSMKLEANDILMMEGIHALNPEFTKGIDQSKLFKVYVSPLTALLIDDGTHNSTCDKRLLRRIVRDNRTRGISPEQNILRWESVRRGEVNNIFPFQENADVVFNSAVIYDLPLLKYFAEPLLCGIAESSPAYAEAQRLLKFLENITALKPVEIAAVPPTSIMREFIGGQTL